MTNYQLAKLIFLSGGIESRKRIQKTVHLLQAAGAEFELAFRLHHYGPYSAELAEKLDWMAENKILLETTNQTHVGKQYAYQLSEQAREKMQSFEATEAGQTAAAGIERFREQLFRLKQTGPRVLELASTLVAYFQDKADWASALAATAAFKQEAVTSPNMQESLHLAQSLVA